MTYDLVDFKLVVTAQKCFDKWLKIHFCTSWLGLKFELHFRILTIIINISELVKVKHKILNKIRRPVKDRNTTLRSNRRKNCNYIYIEIDTYINTYPHI